jgi:hypothetical protein
MPRNSKQEPEQPRVDPLEPPYDGAPAAALELLGPIALFRTWARRPDLRRRR